MRLFIAVPPPPELTERAAALLPADLPALKRVRPELMHVTLARVREGSSGPEAGTIAAAADALSVPDLRTRVDRIAVVESVLSPKGPRYIARVEAPLGSGDRG